MSPTETKSAERPYPRWLLLTAAVTSMMLVGLYQYSWPLIVQPMSDESGWPIPVVQGAFVAFTWVMTLTQPVAGMFADSKGPRIINLSGALMAGIGWAALSRANTPETFFLAYGLGGVGVGIFYATSMGTANKWFPDRRGLATGLASFGFGFGAAVFNPMIYNAINAFGIRTTLLQLGLTTLATLVVTGLLTVYPHSSWTPQTPDPKKTVTAKTEGTTHQYGIREMISTGQWWQIYLAFILTANLGLMITSQLKPLGSSLNLEQDVIIIASSAWPFANGLGRILGGWVSDRLRRERTMFLYFSIQGTLILSLQIAGLHPTSFITIVVLLGLVWGPVFAFFPSIIADYYGRENSTANYGLTYTAKGWGALLGGFALALLAASYGGYSMPIIISAVFSFSAAVLVAPRLLKRPK